MPVRARSQTLFICRNNAWAISTPVKDQYRGDGLVARGVSRDRDGSWELCTEPIEVWTSSSKGTPFCMNSL